MILGNGMPTRNVVITDHQERMIGTLVESGRYKNASEVLREGLRLVERREAEDRAKLVALRHALDEAEEDISAGALEDYSADLLDEIDREASSEPSDVRA